MEIQNQSFQDDAAVFQVMFEYATVGIILVNEAGEITKVNPFALKLFGYNEEELISQKVELLIPQARRSTHVNHRSRYAKHPAPRAMGLDMDLYACRKSGEKFPVEVSLSSARHGNRNLVITFINDISDRKKAEKTVLMHKEQLAKYANQLEDKVQERTNELENAFNQILSSNRKLEREVRERMAVEEALRNSQLNLEKALDKEKELSELKSRFVSMASHEFRTPLSTILSSADLLELYKKPEQEHKRVRHLNRIKSSVRNLTSILNDFLSLEKLESGKIRLQVCPTNIPELVEEVVEGLSVWKKKGQEVVFSYDHDQVLNIDPYLLRNSLVNLLSNALKYSPEDKEIRLISSIKNDELEIQIIDQGIGIPSEDVQHMFTRFFRAANASNIQGTGLGLTIVKRYIDLMDGQIRFESEEGKGSTFIVTIPGPF